MKLLLIILTVLLNSTLVSAFTVSLERGDIVDEISMRGSLGVRCTDGQRTRTFYSSCYDSFLKGGNYGRIVLSNGSLDADYVKIKNIKSKWVKKLKFDSEKGQTRKNLNLWVRSLTQRAKLYRGENTLTYRFYKNKKEVASGEFTITVVEGENRNCSRRFEQYSVCPSVSTACYNYFRGQNFCR